MIENNPILNKVLEFATQAHLNQFRKDGKTPFINHPIKLVENLYNHKYDKNIALISSALLHDILEDTHYSTEELQSFLNTIGDFSYVNETMFYVTSMTNKYTKKLYPHLNRKDRKILEFNEFKKWTDEDLKVLKIADILANLSDFKDLELDFAKIYIMEDFEILRILRTDKEIWNTALHSITCEFKNLLTRN